MKPSDLSLTDLIGSDDAPTAEGRPTPLPERSGGPLTDAAIPREEPPVALPLSASWVEAQAVREIMGTNIECEFDEMNIAVTIVCMKRLSAETGKFPIAVELGGDINSYASWRSAAITHLRLKEKEKFNESTINIG